MADTNNTRPDKLDEIIECLHRMDRRDRLRTIGGFVRGILALIPLVVFAWGTWYAITHADELMKKIADEAAASAAKYTQQGSSDLLENILKKYGDR